MSYLDEHLDRVVECHGVSDEEREKISRTAKEIYQKDDLSKIYKMTLAMGSMSLDMEETEARVEGCNVFSRANLIGYQRSKDEVFDHKICDARK